MTLPLTITEFLGRFHPMVVHLPIGILMLGVAMHWLAGQKQYASFRQVLPTILLAGVVAALASCVSGFLLSRSGDYDEGTVNLHQWLALATTAISIGLFYLVKSEKLQRWQNAVSILLIVLLTLAGHWGGTLTHGKGYLLAGLQSTDRKQSIPPIANIQEAVLYKDAIQPLLEARCYQCHGLSKTKGKLRLDSEEGIMKGGEEGKVLLAGQAGSSAIIERLLLPKEDEKHMPPKEKPQLSKQEIALLHWWINSGASLTKQVKDLPQPSEVKPLLAMLSQGSKDADDNETMHNLPAEAIAAAAEGQIASLRQTGAVVLPVASLSNYLSVNLSTLDSSVDIAMERIKPLATHVVWLYAGNSSITDKHLETLRSLTNLTRLHLQNTGISDMGLRYLSPLKHLSYLNLTGTRVSLEGLLTMGTMPGLRRLYLYQTAVPGSNIAQVKNRFPNAIIDSGNYKVPTLVQDTTVVKEVK